MKNKRQEAILDLIKNEICVTQDDLQEKLTGMGFNVTQSTISRDIKQLRIIKALDGDGNYRYMAPSSQPVRRIHTHSGEHYLEMFSHSVISVESAFNDVVVKCYAGMASSACVAIDGMFSEKIVGSLAGDDTVFIITKTPQIAEDLTSALNKLIAKD